MGLFQVHLRYILLFKYIGMEMYSKRGIDGRKRSLIGDFDEIDQ